MSDTVTENYSVQITKDALTGNILTESWYIHDNDHERLHRSHDLPAYIEYDQNSGQEILIQFWKDGTEHRDGDKPSAIRIDPETGVVLHERRMKLGNYVEDRPAVIDRDRETGETILVLYSRDGNLTRQRPEEATLDGPKNEM